MQRSLTLEKREVHCLYIHFHISTTSEKGTQWSALVLPSNHNQAGLHMKMVRIYCAQQIFIFYCSSVRAQRDCSLERREHDLLRLHFRKVAD